MTPAIPASHPHAYYHCPPPDPLGHCPAPDALHLQSQAHEQSFESAFLQSDGQQMFGSLVHVPPSQEVMGAFLPDTRSASPIHPRLAVQQASKKVSSQFSDDWTVLQGRGLRVLKCSSLHFLVLKRASVTEHVKKGGPNLSELLCREKEQVI